MKTQRKPDDQQGVTHLDAIGRLRQMLRREGPVKQLGRQRLALDLHHGDIDRATAVLAFAPDGKPVTVQRNRKADRVGHVFRLAVQLDLDAVRVVLAWLVEHHMAAGHHEEPAVALEEESARVGQRLLALKGRNPDGSQKDGFDHRHDVLCACAPR